MCLERPVYTFQLSFFGHYVYLKNLTARRKRVMTEYLYSVYCMFKVWSVKIMIESTYFVNCMFNVLLVKTIIKSVYSWRVFSFNNNNIIVYYFKGVHECAFLLDWCCIIALYYYYCIVWCPCNMYTCGFVPRKYHFDCLIHNVEGLFKQAKRFGQRYIHMPIVLSLLLWRVTE